MDLKQCVVHFSLSHQHWNKNIIVLSYHHTRQGSVNWIASNISDDDIVRFKSDPLAAFTFWSCAWNVKAARGSDLNRTNNEWVSFDHKAVRVTINLHQWNLIREGHILCSPSCWVSQQCPLTAGSHSEWTPHQVWQTLTRAQILP